MGASGMRPSVGAIAMEQEGGSSGSTSPANDSSTQVELRPTPHSGRPLLDQLPDGEQLLCDAVSYDRVAVPPGWSRHFDDELSGRAVLICVRGDEGEPEVRCAEDVLKLDIAEASDGARFVIWLRDKGKEPQSLDVALSWHVPATMALAVGAAQVTVDIDVWVMKRVRPFGLCVFWEIARFYSLLSLTSYAKQPSKWVHHSMASWELAMCQLPRTHFLHSRHTNSSGENLQRIPWFDRPLSNTGVSTIAIVLLLGRWAFASAMQRGLRSQQGRSAAADLLASICKFACQKTSPFVVFAVSDWACTWPRPAPLEWHEVSVELSFVAGGRVQLSNLSEAGKSKCRL